MVLYHVCISITSITEICNLANKTSFTTMKVLSQENQSLPCVASNDYAYCLLLGHQYQTLFQM